jgi:murein L,D-transpeptidase YcbB/YkuD
MQAGQKNSKLHSILLLAAGTALMTAGLPRTAGAQVGPPLPPPAALIAPASPATAEWTAQDIAQLARALRHAAANGLDAAALRREVAAAAPGDNVVLDRVALSYARALASGVVDPSGLHDVFTLPTNRPDLRAGLQTALAGHRIAAWLASLPPQDEEYRALSQAYLAARAAAHAHPGSHALSGKARTLAVNLERRRWLARAPAATRIDVNVAAARLWFWRDGALVDSRKVVAGSPHHETPLIAASFSRIVTNPPWNVPASIARREILPKGAGYLARHDMRVVDGRVVQAPGPGSALGLVKFDLDDDQDIYLHDTPAQAAFDREDRNLSHGCIRVEDAVGFARLVAETFGVADQFDERLASGDTRSVSLGAEVPVRLLYETAYVDDGQVAFAPDVYGWDSDLAAALGMGEAIAAPVGDRS